VEIVLKESVKFHFWELLKIASNYMVYSKSESTKRFHPGIVEILVHLFEASIHLHDN